MTRLTALNPEEVTGKTKDLFNAVQAKLGVVPNMMRTMGNSPAVLEGYLNLSGALSHGKLSAKTGELIALTVSESNSCDYCLAAHTFIGEKLIKANLGSNITFTTSQPSREYQNIKDLERVTINFFRPIENIP